MVSVIIPVYNEESIIANTVYKIVNILEKNVIDYEIILVDDGSNDRSFDKMCVLAKNNARVRGLSFSRNFGKESAIYAGLSEARGDCSVVIDADLQHPPEKIPEMYKLWENGYEIVEGRKKSRGEENGIRLVGAKMFYKCLSAAIGIDMMESSDFKLLDEKVVIALLNMPERNTFFRALSQWVGYKSTSIEYDVGDRADGKSKWTTGKLFKYAISNITSFTNIPMYIITLLGIIMFVMGLVLSGIALYQKLNGISLEGFTTVIILQCFSSSVIMIGIGILGYYLSKVFDEVRHRPKYIIHKKTYES